MKCDMRSTCFVRFQSRDSDSDSVMSTDLYVEGFAICARGKRVDEIALGI